MLTREEVESLHKSRRKDEQVLRELSHTNQQVMIKAEATTTCLKQMIIRLEQKLRQERMALKMAEAIVSSYPTKSMLVTLDEQAKSSNIPLVDNNTIVKQLKSFERISV